jgi:hypothetical protein
VRQSKHLLWLIGATGMMVLLVAAVARPQVVLYPHWAGQNVAPVYEGYVANPDGTSTMWFGYMNRNVEEEPDIAIGPNNKFAPGDPDRGQPTHFAARRHKDVFPVTLPANFGNATLVWSVTVRGKTESVPGSLNPKWLIDRDHTTRGGDTDDTVSNTPPVVNIQPPAQTIGVGARAKFNVSATDDGRPARGGVPLGMTIDWFKYRGPGTVTIDKPSDQLKDGKTTTTAAFSALGDYTLLAVIDDGSGQNAANFGYHCCWTDVEVHVTVR